MGKDSADAKGIENVPPDSTVPSSEAQAKMDKIKATLHTLKDKLLARDELEEGRAVQRALLPNPDPAIPGWDVWLTSIPANDVGGDLVDVMRLDAERYGLTLADVAGKGLGAPLLMAKLQATLRALAWEYPDLGDLGGRLNRILCRDGLPNKFATLVHLDVQSDSGRVRLINGGHMPPLLVRGGRSVELQKVAAWPLASSTGQRSTNRSSRCTAASCWSSIRTGSPKR